MCVSYSHAAYSRMFTLPAMALCSHAFKVLWRYINKYMFAQPGRINYYDLYNKVLLDFE